MFFLYKHINIYNNNNNNNNTISLFFLKKRMEIRGKYKIIHLLGQGKFGKVFQAQTKSYQFVAIKMECTKSINKGLLKHEVTILHYLNQKKCIHIPNVLWFGIESNITCFVMPFYSISLTEYIKENKLRNEIQIMQSMLTIIKSIHCVYVIHRDIKPDNFMLNEKHQLILIDFGLSIFITKENDVLKKKEKEDHLITGNLLFASPKIHEYYYSRKIDDLISIAYIGLYICLKLTLPWINKLSVNYLKLKSYENLQLYVNKETKMILDYINKLYHDNLLYVYE